MDKEVNALGFRRIYADFIPAGNSTAFRNFNQVFSCLDFRKNWWIKQKNDNDLYDKYFDLLETTITDCVIATNQTYVDALKQEGKFDAEAQKIAFQKTYEAVMSILTEDAKEYLIHALGDFDAFVNAKIEANVKAGKTESKNGWDNFWGLR